MSDSNVLTWDDLRNILVNGHLTYNSKSFIIEGRILIENYTITEIIDITNDFQKNYFHLVGHAPNRMG